MAHDLEGFVDELTAEGLKEAADTFFGRRKDLESDLEVLQSQAKKVETLGKEACTTLARLHFLLLEGMGVPMLYDGLHLTPPAERDVPRSGHWPPGSKICIPKAMTKKGRYVGVVLKAYDSAQKAVNDYLHGRISADPHCPGRKLLSPNLEQMKIRFAKINAEVANLNEHYRASDVLLFAKRLDVQKMEAEDNLGGGGQYTLDKELSFEPLVWDDLGLPDLPDLPKTAKAEGCLRDMAGRLFKEDKHHAEAVLARIG
ncbi:MAG: hypothetical protein EOM25_02030 [Deltaproteobacteria bacterium]|nr:hypothetical protein [Deltaproteobacteria bacterium]